MNHATHTPITQLAAVVDERLMESVALVPLYRTYDGDEDGIVRQVFAAIRALAYQPARLLGLVDELEADWLRADARADRHVIEASAELVSLNRESRRLSLLTTTAVSVRAETAAALGA